MFLSAKTTDQITHSGWSNFVTHTASQMVGAREKTGTRCQNEAFWDERKVIFLRVQAYMYRKTVQRISSLIASFSDRWFYSKRAISSFS